MTRRHWFLPATVAMAALVTSASAEVFQFTGAAESSDGKALYEERHQIEGSCESGVFRPLEHRVAYIRQTESDAEAFAEKKLDYSLSPIRPRVNYQQPDFDESLEITYPDSGSVAVVWQQPGGDTKRSRVEVSNNLVVDAGFDNLVRQNWDKVVSGESVKFRFLAPTRGTDYAFILEPAQSQVVNADHVVQIRPDSVLLKFLVDPIILGYNSEGALTAYSGLTNVRENADQNYTAAIRYTVSTYPECELAP
jgi:hypothetical protein